MTALRLVTTDQRFPCLLCPRLIPAGSLAYEAPHRFSGYICASCYSVPSRRLIRSTAIKNSSTAAQVVAHRPPMALPLSR